MIEDLHWLGITWQGPIINQSERLPLYREAFETYASSGHIYPCTCSRKDLARLPTPRTKTEDDEPIYHGHCRANSRSTTTIPIPNTAYRFRVPDSEAITFTDQNLGPQCFIAGRRLRRLRHSGHADGIPSYQLASVVDDAAMHITEVVRGRDLLKSTARQILLQRALNLPTPTYFHTHLLTDEHGIRLAKRHDALAIRTLREQGLTPAEVLRMTSVTSDS